jgi:hypothetical protein
MGMDVFGNNPKINTKEGDFSVYEKYNSMNFEQKWDELDADNELKDKYFEEEGKFQNINKGVYFRNNVWAWRPLWNYCYEVADGLIDEDTFQKGHENSGAGLNKADSIELGKLLLKEIAEGRTKLQEDSYTAGTIANSYPFSEENVKRFAEFLLECGGFEIC